MSKLGNGGLFVAAIALVVTGMFLRLDLLDWLIDLMGFLLIASGVVVGVVAAFRGLSGSRGGSTAA